MAIRLLKGRASPWQVYWNNPLSGKRETRTFTTELEARKYDSLVKHRITFERDSFREPAQGSDVVQQAVPTPQSSLTLEKVYLKYLREKQFDQNGLNWQMHSMRTALLQLGNQPVSEITTAMLMRLRDTLAETDIKPVTLRSKMRVLSTVLRWAQRNGYCEAIPVFPPLPVGQYKKFVPPTASELDALMKVAPAHIKRVIVLGAQFGVRVGQCELLRLKWEDVDLERQIVRVHGAKKNMNAPWREVPIRASLLEVFRQWREEDRALGCEYIVHYKKKPISSVNTAWNTALRNAGITRHIRPYDLRHAFGTEMVAAGVDVGTVANLMGHSSPTMLLKHYQYVLAPQKKAAVEALPALHF